MSSLNDQQGVAENIETESNYGSEFGTDDEAALSSLLIQAASQERVIPVAVRHSIEGEGGDAAIHIAYEHDTVPILTNPRTRKLVHEDGIQFQALAFHAPTREASVEIEYDARNRIAFSRGSILLHT
jgi:hypothetical protein